MGNIKIVKTFGIIFIIIIIIIIIIKTRCTGPSVKNKSY